MIRASPIAIGISAGRIASVFIIIPIPRTIPAIPKKIDSFVIVFVRYFGL